MQYTVIAYPASSRCKISSQKKGLTYFLTQYVNLYKEQAKLSEFSGNGQGPACERGSLET